MESIFLRFKEEEIASGLKKHHLHYHSNTANAPLALHLQLRLLLWQCCLLVCSLTVIENRPEPKHKIGAKGGIAQTLFL